MVLNPKIHAFYLESIVKYEANRSKVQFETVLGSLTRSADHF